MHKVWVFILLFTNAFGQVKFPLNYHLKTLNGDDDLSQMCIYFRYEDSRGFMWFAANDAINRYDGNAVKVYNLKRHFKNCPNLEQGYGFAEDLEKFHIGTGPGSNIITLPALAGVLGREYLIINHGQGNLQTNLLFKTGFSSTDQYLLPGLALHLVSDGTDWRKIN